MSTRIDTRRLDQLTAGLSQKTRQIVLDISKAVADKTQQNILSWPAVDTGTYLGSVVMEDLETEGAKTTATVGPRVEYSVYVELGTHKMAARPSTAPAAEAVSADISKFVGDITK